eukprot:1147646-Pelagomonas_calceolata.AAC.1
MQVAGGLRRLFFSFFKEGEAATVRDQPSNTQHQHHPPPAAGAAAGAAASWQNTGGAVKGQGASADQDSRAQARKIAQTIKATWRPPRRYRTSGGYVGPPSYGNWTPAFWFPLGS